MPWTHTYKCIACNKTVEFRTPNEDSDSPRLVSLFHSELAASKNINNVTCLGRMLWLSTVPVTLPAPAAPPPYTGPTISYGNLPVLAQQWVIAMRQNGNQGSNVPTNLLPNTCSNNGQHITDPLTGQQRAGGVGVYEYYIGGPAGHRATARSGPPTNALQLFWSTNHMGNAYNYNLITNLP